MGGAGGTVLNMLGAGGGAMVLLALINAFVTRRHRGAETENLSATATKAITDAASGVVERIEGDNIRLRVRVEQLEAATAQHDRDREAWALERQEWRRALQVHVSWDALAISRLAAADPPIDLPAAPPLTPPTLERTPLT